MIEIYILYGLVAGIAIYFFQTLRFVKRKIANGHLLLRELGDVIQRTLMGVKPDTVEFYVLSQYCYDGAERIITAYEVMLVNVSDLLAPSFRQSFVNRDIIAKHFQRIKEPELALIEKIRQLDDMYFGNFYTRLAPYVRNNKITNKVKLRQLIKETFDMAAPVGVREFQKYFEVYGFSNIKINQGASGKKTELMQTTVQPTKKLSLNEQVRFYVEQGAIGEALNVLREADKSTWNTVVKKNIENAVTLNSCLLAMVNDISVSFEERKKQVVQIGNSILMLIEQIE